MPNIWHLTHQTSKYELHKVFQSPKILTHHYSTISNMRRDGYKCQTKILIFYSTFSPSSQYFIQRFFSLFTDLSLSNPCSLSFFFRSPSLTLKSTVRRPHRSSCCRFEDAIIVGLKPPPSSVWSRHCHFGLKLPYRLDLNPSQPGLEVVALLVWCAS